MTHLRQIMLEELRRRNYAESTIHAYIHTVEHFSRHFHRSPDQLGPEHIRQYQAALFTRWKLTPNTVTQRLAALRFFYVQVLKRGWSVAETPYPKKVLRKSFATLYMMPSIRKSWQRTDPANHHPDSNSVIT